LKKIILNLSF